MKLNREKIRSFLTDIYHPYRIVIYNDHLERKGTFRLTILNLIFFFSVMVSITFILAYLLIAFTPIRVTIPGITNASNNADNERLYKLEQRADSLENALREKDLQMKSLKKILSGDSSTSFIRRYSKNNIYHLADFHENSPEVSTDDKPAGQVVFFPPVRGYISDHFAPASGHYAIDIVSAKNAPVKATLDGYVIFSEWSASTGNVIILQHQNNLLSVYKHNSVLLKKVGTFVRSGEAIALVGNSGELTSGPHLHFELWQNGNPLNPEEFVAF